jgi:hypothetical protein
MPDARALRMTLPPVRPPRSSVLPSMVTMVPSGRTCSTMPTWEMRSTLSPGKSKKTTRPSAGRIVQRPRPLNQAAPDGV